jgi:hypothetical protein
MGNVELKKYIRISIMQEKMIKWSIDNKFVYKWLTKITQKN